MLDTADPTYVPAHISAAADAGEGAPFIQLGEGDAKVCVCVCVKSCVVSVESYTYAHFVLLLAVLYNRYSCCAFRLDPTR
jgi:hypothetical protein